MASSNTVDMTDLFCGGGGTSSGAAEACEERGLELNLTAVNHNERAIQTHWANFPKATHHRQDIRALQPRKVIKSGRLDLLVGSPECRAYSPARGNKPWLPQFRTSPREILRWTGDLDVPNGLFENVPEFQDWGPQDEEGRPIPAFRGIFYKRFIDALKDQGYSVEDRILTAADYGDATTRQRLFIQARRGYPISWPKPTHTREQWRPARDIIDWTLKGTSIFNRRKPLAENTLRRIISGIEKIGGQAFKPFLVMFYGTNDIRSLMRPLPTITAKGQHIGLVEFVLGQQSGSVARDVSQPIPTISTSGAISLIRAFIVKYYGTGAAVSVENPLDTITTKDRFALVTTGPGPHYGLEITLRMLAPHELAAAMSFRKGYIFSGTQAEQVHQIGNAVPVKLARAIIGEILDTYEPLRLRRAA